MKYLIVLLAIAAVVVAVPQSRGITDTIGKLITDFTGSVFGTLDKILSDVKALTSGTLGKAGSIVSLATGEISKMITNVENELNEMIARGGAAKTCAMNQLAQLTTIKTNAINRVNGCATDVTDSVVSFEQDIVNRISELKTSLNDLVSLATDCTKQILSAVTCAISKINDGYMLVEEVTSNINGAIDQARSTAEGALVGVQTCATSTVNMVTQQVQQIGDDAKRCIM